jgi:hypothetical protein
MEHATTETPVWINTQQLADMLGCAKNTIEVKRHLGLNQPPHYKIGIGRRTKVLYKLSEVNAWIESHRVIPAAVKLAEMAGA